MAENYGTLEGTLDEHGVLSGEMSDRATLEGEIQFGSGGGGVLDVFQNGQSVVQGRYAYVTVPTFLRELRSDDYHNTVTTLEIQNWNGKADASDIPENITDLSDIAVDNIQNGQVLKWDATQEKFVNANESGGSGDVTDVKVNDTSVVDAQGVANIDLTGYAEKSDLGTASALDVAVSGDASTSQVVKGDDTRLTDARPASDVSSWAKASTKPDYTASEVGAIATTAKGTANGVAELDENGKVPSAQLPSYVDDVLEYASVSVFPATGESGKIYIALDTNKTYRWSGTTYIEISESLALGETDSTAYAGNKGKQNADNIAAIQGLIPSSATTSNKLATASDIPDISGKADKSEMSVSTSGDQTTIQLKNGTSATVLNAHQSITGKADKVTNATENNFAALDANGNLKDSGHKHSDYLTQHQDISGKADKVSGATDGHIAGLDANGNLTDSGLAATTIVHKADKVSGQVAGHLASLSGTGNLTDSGWNGAKDTTSISGNPISISGLKANQLASNPIITLEPIQAGSGTPSPSNIRAISGYDKVEVLSCGKNILAEIEQGTWNTASGSKMALTNRCRSTYLMALGSTQYTLSAESNVSGKFASVVVQEYTYSNGTYTNTFDSGWQGAGYTFTATQGRFYAFLFSLTGNPDVTPISFKNVQLEKGSSATTYEPYNKATSISESLGQTVYGLTHEVRTGKARVTRTIADLGDLSWTYDSSGHRFFSNSLVSLVGGSTDGSIYTNVVFSCYKKSIDASNNSAFIFANNKYLYVYDNRYTDAASFKTAIAGQTVCYELATPFTIQLTPHEISLLKDYAYVSTNGTSIALDYHNGEMASLADVSQLGETVNLIGNGMLKHQRIKHVFGNVTANNFYDYNMTAEYENLTWSNVVSITMTTPTGNIFDHKGVLIYRPGSNNVNIVIEYQCGSTATNVYIYIDILYV